MGLQFLSWEEHLEDGEQPPRSIWFNEEELSAHFERVKADRKAKYGGKDDGPGPIEDPVENQAAKGLIVGG